ncbi:signal recognition particle-docking protein FtsY [Beggiatoa alba B18LD]|uniref:Signal recognition particle receptor FtsY n=1 Tax=Beggiatoa alba B18LD TaxID=395493 RepID=I3CEN4_9GAMM|nr:signal recognition particle-docking protein FtsY [Beggiatoa alba]EIJ42077.1 signal recognition particle-docking protein FtsY [Beggiatoa alba B18LD]
MFTFGKKKDNPTNTTTSPEQVSEEVKPNFFNRLKQGLSRTRASLTAGLSNLLLGKKAIDADLLDELETLLLSADMGIEATQAMIKDLTERTSRQQLKDSEALFHALQADMVSLLKTAEKPLVLPEKLHKPFVLLMVGVNGSGKTTTIGKLAKRFQAEGRSVMLAAGDTFRAAAVEQLQIWGERNQVTVVAQQGKADSAAVIFDALQSATAKGIDVLIADTAGRLHTQSNLMEELKKVKRVLQKLDAAAPHEIMLILDASIGQNALVQAQQFHQAVGVTGVTLTKLDGTAKGGMIFAVAKKLNIPIRFIGVGEQPDDLRVFSADNFVNALLSREE